jgi:hypothetical protein
MRTLDHHSPQYREVIRLLPVFFEWWAGTIEDPQAIDPPFISWQYLPYVLPICDIFIILSGWASAEGISFRRRVPFRQRA